MLETVDYQYESDIMSLEWWQKNIIYHIYLPSFKDSNKDGIGDFKGLISKMNYFEELNIKTLLLSPFYPSPMKDNGYDVSSYLDIDPMYGTMDDFESLIEELKKRDLNIMVDLVANHTSDQHEWFKKSVTKEEPYSDYYIWVDKSPESTEDKILPPNNWLSVFGGSAWTWSETRKQFYFHQFLPEQPDLNFRNSKVIDEIKKVMTFWLDKGVDGFRVDAASHLYEDELLRDEPVSGIPVASPDEHAYLDHIYTKGLEENFDLLKEFRTVLDELREKTGKSKILVTEVIEDMSHVMNYYGVVGDKIADFPFNFELYKLTANTTGVELFQSIDAWLSSMPKGKYSNWVLSSHDDPRVKTRVGKLFSTTLQICMMLLPGIPICYYGDEIGMENTHVEPGNIRDSFALRTSPENSRDPSRTPMQWDGGKNAGFTDADKPWLPINEKYKTVNVEVQKNDPSSLLNLFKYLLKLREEPSVLVGTLDYPLVTQDIFSLLRFLVGAKCFLLMVNTSQKSICVNLLNASHLLPSEAILEISNGHFYHSEGNESTEKCEECLACLECECEDKNYADYDFSENVVKISLSSIHLRPKQTIVLSFLGKLLV